MLSSKSKSSMLDAVNSKGTSTSKNGKPGSIKLEFNSPPPKKHSFPSGVSPKTAESKPVANRWSPKSGAPPDKQSRTWKVPELQLQLTAVREELIKAKEQLAFEEKEKARFLEELNYAKKEVEEVYKKLADTLLAQKKAEENLELDKFRADELKQLAIDAAQKREKEWGKQLEDIQNQHAVSAAELLSATEELQKARHELTISTDAKNTALSHADDAQKVAEINAKKVVILSGEIDRLQTLLVSKLENKSNETANQIKELDSDVEVLKNELEKARLAEEKLVEMEALVEGLKVELIDTRRAECDAIDLVDDWKTKAELLESYLEEAKQSERLVQNSLASLTIQLDEAKSVLDAESEVVSLRRKVEALELDVARHKADHETSDSLLNSANQEVLGLEKTVEVLKSELLRVEDEKAQALNNEKITTSNLEILAQEKVKLANELEITKEDSEKAKKAMEDIVSALQEMSAEVRYVNKELLIKQAEVDNATAEADILKLALKNTQENYEVMLDEAKYEILCLKKAIDKSEIEAKDMRAEWNEKEINLINVMRKTDDGIASIMLERNEVVETLERKKFEVIAAEEEVTKLHDILRQAENELFAANGAMEEGKAESRCLKERLLDKENELQSITQENNDLRIQITAASEKIEELSESLAKLSSKEEDGHKRGNADYGENVKLSNNGKLPMMVKLMEVKVETETWNLEETLEDHVVLKGAIQLEENESEKSEVSNRVQMKPNACDGIIIDKLSSDMDPYAKSIEDELNNRTGRNNMEQVNVWGSFNGNISPTKHHELQKKKKDFLHKFGSMLKMKNALK